MEIGQGRCERLRMIPGETRSQGCVGRDKQPAGVVTEPKEGMGQ